MGWSSGTYVARDLIKAIQSEIPQDELLRYRLYLKLIRILQKKDWDCENEAEGIDSIFDRALQDLNEIDEATRAQKRGDAH